DARAMDNGVRVAASVDEATAELIRDCRETLRAGRTLLALGFEAHADIPRLLWQHARLVDRALTTAWCRLRAPENAALVAVGGYGRGQLCPHSDVDVLILLARPVNAAEGAYVERFIGTVWDIGLEVGHSVRT